MYGVKAKRAQGNSNASRDSSTLALYSSWKKNIAAQQAKDNEAPAMAPLFLVDRILVLARSSGSGCLEFPQWVEHDIGTL